KLSVEDLSVRAIRGKYVFDSYVQIMDVNIRDKGPEVTYGASGAEPEKRMIPNLLAKRSRLLICS
ncbi:hypothetical protein A2U01_0118308, partial [Trifolium medium]|nr:hypothetical protein [Trifolium medium]